MNYIHVIVDNICIFALKSNSMNNPFISYKWRNRIDEITPSNLRIGTDVLLIEDANAIRAERIIDEEPFKVDMSMAIIYDQGEAVIKIDMHKYNVKAPAVIICKGVPSLCLAHLLIVYLLGQKEDTPIDYTPQ